MQSKCDDFSCDTFIVPTASCGNVPQLMADIAVESLAAMRVGTLWSPFVLNICGPDMFMNKNLSLPLEVYSNQKFGILQQRAPTIPDYQAQFADNLADWLSARCSKVILFASADARFSENGQRVVSMLEDIELQRFKGSSTFYDTVKALKTRNIQVSGVIVFTMEGGTFSNSDNLADAVAAWNSLGIAPMQTPKCWD